MAAGAASLLLSPSSPAASQLPPSLPRYVKAPVTGNAESQHASWPPVLHHSFCRRYRSLRRSFRHGRRAAKQHPSPVEATSKRHVFQWSIVGGGGSCDGPPHHGCCRCSEAKPHAPRI
ncbi:hypothetical protein D1007_28795 [Hordeum vulgare]|nr:hypothetical protein D1007_28795 [Hordeum vulgare]